MKIAAISLFAAVALTTLAATPVKKKSTAKKHTTTKQKAKTGALAGVTGPRNHQAAPTPERYKEIQQALVAKGYLKSEPNGVWDADSTDAMRRFQAERKLDPSGKINAPSLIGLGLGPQTQANPMPLPPPQTPAPVSPAPAPR